MVELSNEMLETYGMTRYKSITIKDDPEALRFTRQCLEADQKGARKIKSNQFTLPSSKHSIKLSVTVLTNRHK